MSYTPLSSNFQPKSVFYPRRRFLHLAFSASAVANYTALSSAFAAAAEIPSRQPAPPMTTEIRDETGKSLRLSAFRGKPILVNFWATWCPPCVAELPALDRAAIALRDQIQVILVSVDRGGSRKALPFLQKRGVTTPALGFDPKAALSREMGVRGLPTTFLLDATQSVSWSYIGPREWDDASMLGGLRDLIGIAVSPAIRAS